MDAVTMAEGNGTHGDGGAWALLGLPPLFGAPAFDLFSFADPEYWQTLAEHFSNDDDPFSPSNLTRTYSSATDSFIMSCLVNFTGFFMAILVFSCLRRRLPNVYQPRCSRLVHKESRPIPLKVRIGTATLYDADMHFAVFTLWVSCLAQVVPLPAEIDVHGADRCLPCPPMMEPEPCPKPSLHWPFP